jgi:hypothetical protein
MEVAIVDDAIIWGVLEFTSNFETIDRISKICPATTPILQALLPGLAQGGHSLSFDGPREDVPILDNQLLDAILKTCKRAEIKSSDFRYVCLNTLSLQLP